MTYVSDRQRVEWILLPMIAQCVIKAGVNDVDHPDAKKAIDLFAQAMLESVQGLPDKKSFSLMRRALRLHEELIKPFRNHESRVDKVGLMLFNIMSWATECDYLVLHDGTPMSLGMDLLLPALQHAANITKLDESARKAAGKMLKTLQEEGYFSGVIVQ